MYIKQLLKEVEHDNLNYKYRVLSYLPKPKGETDYKDTMLNSSWYQVKTEFGNCFNYTSVKNNPEKKTPLSGFAKV